MAPSAVTGSEPDDARASSLRVGGTSARLEGTPSVPDVTVRLASTHDAEPLASMIQRFNDEFDEPTPAHGALSARLTTYVGRGSMWALIASHGSVPCGFATVSMRDSAYSAGPVALIEDLWVEPADRNSGIGSLIMARLAAEALARHCAIVDVTVDEHDVDALRFYERHRFVHREPRTGERAYYLFRDVCSEPRS